MEGGGLADSLQRKHVSGSTFKSIRQAEKHPRLALERCRAVQPQQKVVAQSGGKVSVTETRGSSPRRSETQLSWVCQLKKHDVM